MKPDELPVVLDLEADRAAHSHWSAEVRESRVCYFEVRNSKSCLNDTGVIDEIDLCLERRASIVSQTDQIRQNRKVLRIRNAVIRTFNEILKCSVAMLVDKYRNLAILHTKRRTPPDRIFPLTVSACRTPFPDEVRRFVTADLVHQSAIGEF